MRLVRKRTQIDFLADACFSIYLFTEFMFKHTILGQVGVVSLIGSVLLLFYEKRKIAVNYYFVFSAMFIIYNFINILNGVPINADTSLQMTYTLIANYFILFFVFNYLVLRNNMQKTTDIFINVGLIFSFLLIVVALPDVFTQRLGGVFTVLGVNISINANTLAIISAFSFLMCYYKYLNNRKKVSLLKLLWFIAIVLLSGSRKGLFMLCVGSAILVYLVFPKKRTKHILISTILIFVFYILIMYIPTLYLVIGFRVEAVIDYALGQSVEEASLVSRLSYTQLGWDYFKLRPWRGYGLDNFRHFPKAYDTYSHNNYVEILVSGGIPAFILYYIAYFISLIKSFRNLKQGSKFSTLFLTMVVISLISDYAMVSYFDRTPLTIFMFLLATASLDKINILSKKTKKG